MGKIVLGLHAHDFRERASFFKLLPGDVTQTEMPDESLMR
jgi:hypothetical protein